MKYKIVVYHPVSKTTVCESVPQELSDIEVGQALGVLKQSDSYLQVTSSDGNEIIVKTKLLSECTITLVKVEV